MYENLAMVEKRTNSNQKGDVLLKAANFQAATMVWWLFAIPCTSSISPHLQIFETLIKIMTGSDPPLWLWRNTNIMRKIMLNIFLDSSILWWCWWALGLVTLIIMALSFQYALFNCKKLIKLTNWYLISPDGFLGLVKV